MRARIIASMAIAVAAAHAHAEPTLYAIDPSHTFVTFEMTHLGTSTLRGRFDKKDGAVMLDKAAKAGKAEITVDANSLSTGAPSLDARLKGKDFLNTEEFGKVQFSADKFDFDGDQVKSVAGTVTILGKTRPVTLKATHYNCYISPLFKREVCGGDFEATIVRSEFGMSSGLGLGLPDDVRLLIQIEAIRQ